MSIADDSRVPPARSRFPLPLRILLGLVVGVALGVVAQNFASRATADWYARNFAKPLGDIFLNMMFMVVVPLVFSSLALGVASLGDLKTVGRLGTKILLWTLLFSSAGVGIGLVVANVVRPGDGLPPEARARLVEATKDKSVETKVAQSRAAASVADTIGAAVSRNPVEDAANLFTPNPAYKGGGILAFLVTAMLAGMAIASLPAAKTDPAVKLLESIQEISMAVVGFALLFAPFGVAGLVFQATVTVGPDLFALLGKYVFAVMLGLFLQMTVTYSLALWFAAGRDPRTFLVQVQEVIVTAFSTSSSNATLPTSLRVARTKVGLPKGLSSFVLTVGATANQNGTALFEGITVLFLAQFYGIHLDLGQQATVVMTSVLAGVGTAGVPGGSLPLIALLLVQVGVPAQGIGVVLGVDRLLDMSRTVVNVVGDIVLATVVSRGAPADEPGDTVAAPSTVLDDAPPGIA